MTPLERLEEYDIETLKEMRHEASLNGGRYRLFKFSKLSFSIIDIEKAIMKKVGPTRYNFYVYGLPKDDEETYEPPKDEKEKKQRCTIRHPMTYGRTG